MCGGAGPGLDMEGGGCMGSCMVECVLWHLGLRLLYVYFLLNDQSLLPHPRFMCRFVQ